MKWFKKKSGMLIALILCGVAAASVLFYLFVVYIGDVVNSVLDGFFGLFS